MALPNEATGFSAVCDFFFVVFPDHTHLLYLCFSVPIV